MIIFYGKFTNALTSCNFMVCLQKKHMKAGCAGRHSQKVSAVVTFYSNLISELSFKNVGVRLEKFSKVSAVVIF